MYKSIINVSCVPNNRSLGGSYPPRITQLSTKLKNAENTTVIDISVNCEGTKGATVPLEKNLKGQYPL